MDKRKIYMIGDSIMQTNKADKYPQTGWGQVLDLFVDDNEVEIINLAKNGTSTKSFLEQGRFTFVEENIKENDVLLIGFAHNDEKINDPLRYTTPFDTFIKNLTYFIDVAKKVKAIPILLTPLIRRKYENGKIVDTHKEYVEAIIKCAKINEVDLIDINRLSTIFFESIKEEDSLRYFMNFEQGLYNNYPLGQKDDSHLRYDGAYLVASLFVQEVYKMNLGIKDLFLEVKAPTYCACDTLEK